MSSRPTISVLISTYNRPHLLRQALRALLVSSDEVPDQLVVVNGGDDAADTVVKSCSNLRSTRVELINTQNKNLAASRNLGLSRCRGEIVAMTDDDAEVCPDWLVRMRSAHRDHPEAGAVGGAVLGASGGGIVTRIADSVTFPSWPSKQYVRTVPGVNISYKREIVERLGPQDETLFRGEDVDFNWRVQREGFKVLFDPSIRVIHHHRSTVGKFLNQHYMYGRAYFLVRRKWPEMYCIYPHGLNQPRDILKAGNFLAGIFYEPVMAAMRLKPTRDRLLSLPLLFLAGLAWRGGMVRQAARELV